MCIDLRTTNVIAAFGQFEAAKGVAVSSLGGSVDVGVPTTAMAGPPVHTGSENPPARSQTTNDWTGVQRMRHIVKKLTAITMISLVSVSAPVLADVPDGIDYQAYLTEPAGAPIDGSVNITFAAYNVAVGGVPLWSETLDVSVDYGLLTVTLGNPVNPFPAGLFDGPVYIGLFVAGEALLPRRQLNATAYSFKSADADTLTGATAGDLDQSAEVAGNAADIASLSGNIAGHDGRIATLEATDITAVDAGAGLSGGGNAGSVSLAIAPGGVVGGMLASSSVGTAQIIDGQVGNADLANNAVNAAKIATGAVGSSEILDGSVSPGDLNTAAAYTVGGLTVDGSLVNTISGVNSTINLASTGDFVIQDAGTDVFRVESIGTLNICDDMFWRDADATGQLIADLIDDGDDGVFRLYENGLISILLDANGTTVFNQQGLARDFRIESDTTAYGFYVDASEDNVGVGTSALDRRFHVAHPRYTGAAGFGGIEIENTHNGAEWTVYVSQSTEDLSLFHEGSLRGQFNDGTGAYTTVSDSRLKRDVQRIESSLDGIMELQPSQFRYSDQDATASLSAGFLAQEVMRVFPEAVYVQPDDTNGYGLPDTHLMDYNAIIPHLVRAIQEQQVLIEHLEKQVAELQAR